MFLFKYVFYLAICLLLLAGVAWGQTTEPISADLFAQLAHPTEADEMGISPCSAERRYGSLVEALASEGIRRLPEVERALQSIEDEGTASEFATNGQWMARVYAKILGAEALPRLRRMAGDPKLAGLQLHLDAAMATSLGLNAMVSTSATVGRRFPCNGTVDLSSALDPFLAAWQKNDAGAFERSLGPQTRRSLELLLADRSWAEFRAEFRPAQARPGAVGYRLRDSGPAPGRPFTDSLTARGSQDAGPHRNVVMVEFTDAFGANCGMKRLEFSKVAGAGSLDPSFVEVPELGEVLRMIWACSWQGAGVP